MNAILKRREIPLPDQVRLGRDSLNELLGKCHLGLAEVVEDIVVNQRFLAGMADAEPQPMEIRTDMRRDRAQAIVPGMAAAGLGPDLAERQVQLVMQNDDIARRNWKNRAASPTARPESFI